MLVHRSCSKIEYETVMTPLSLAGVFAKVRSA